MTSATFFQTKRLTPVGLEVRAKMQQAKLYFKEAFNVLEPDEKRAGYNYYRADRETRRC